MKSNAAQRIQVVSMGAAMVLVVAGVRAFGGSTPFDLGISEPECATKVEVAGRVTRPGLVCAREVAGAVSAARGASCALEASDGSRALRHGARVLVGEGEGGSCAVRIGRMSGERAIALGVPIDVNVAGARDLEALPGVGPGLAARIVARRRAFGPFERIEGLRAVRGIGPQTLAKIRPFVEVR
jgi:competence protein ComEA